MQCRAKHFRFSVWVFFAFFFSCAPCFLQCTSDRILDGDLLLQFLHLPKDDQHRLVQGPQATLPARAASSSKVKDHDAVHELGVGYAEMEIAPTASSSQLMTKVDVGQSLPLEHVLKILEGLQDCLL